MVEVIRTYAGYNRTEGRVKQTFAHMYRCKQCGHITESKTVAEAHLKCKEKQK